MTEPRHDWHPLPSGVELHAVHWDPAPGTDEQVPWLLVHGLASNARLWDGVAQRLAALGHRVVAVDQRGHGRSSKPDHGYDMTTVADDLQLLIDALGLTRPAVAGQSWGGNVVLELAYRNPHSVTMIACVDGGFIDLGAKFPDWDDAAVQLAPPRLAGTPLEQIHTWLETSAADWPATGREGTLANFEVRDDGTVAPWLTFDRHLQVLRGLWEHQPSTRYPKVLAPALLVGADTGDVAWSHSKHDAVDAAIARLPRGRAEWFSPAHHDVHAQHPLEVAELFHRAVTDPSFFDGEQHSEHLVPSSDTTDDPTPPSTPTETPT
jgi:pimeloyl-ACP methyl ester carboxylesterase